MTKMVNLQTLHPIILSDSNLLLEMQSLVKAQHPQMEIQGSTNSSWREVEPKLIKILFFTQYGLLKE